MIGLIGTGNSNLKINALDIMIMKTAIIESTIIDVTLPHGHLRESTTKEGETRDANQGPEIEKIIIIEDTVMIVVKEGGVTQGTREEKERKRKESRREEASSRSTGKKGVCTHGRKMIMMLTKRNYNFLLRNWPAETDSGKITTLSRMILLDTRISHWLNIQPLLKYNLRKLRNLHPDLGQKVLKSCAKKQAQVILFDLLN